MTGTGTAHNPLADDATYVRNMAALFRSDMDLAQRIDECEPDATVTIAPARRGGATASVVSARTGMPVYLHSRIDPESEAERFAESIALGEHFCFVMGGFGLGYHLRALARRLKGDSFIVVTEPNLALIRAALETVDLTDLLTDNRCVILTGSDKGEMHSRLGPHNTLMMMGAQFVTHPASEQAAGAFHAHMRQLVTDYMTFCRMNIVTLVTNSRITCRNIANNLPKYLATPPIDVLRDRFKSVPGIVIAAGPSLRHHIDRLADLQGRAVLVSVQTTFKMLLECGIEPHFVTSLDYHEMSRRFFEGIPGDCRTHLVAEPKATWHVADSYRGPVSMLDNPFARLCVGDPLAARSGLKAGATVAHLALYLAVYLGCDPIVLVGQDLAYTNHVYYMPGVAMHALWQPQLNRFCTMEMMEWERIVRSRPILMKTEDIHGREVYTDEQLFTYLQQFEGDFSAIGGRVIDATEGGVRKAGTQVMPLAEVAERFCTAPIPADALAYLDETDWHDPSRLEAGRSELIQRIEEIAAMRDTSRRMLTLLKKMTTLLDTPAEFNRHIAQVDALRLQVEQQYRAYQMISSVSQLAEFQRFSADRRLGQAEKHGTERARGQLERDMRFVEAVIEGADAIEEILKEALARFERGQEPTA